ncbi:hypothetical protein THRCLA_07565 [Thraustotheca clavata]|uniref:Uncharacterized protein n=1 Tax=Thraustotheca clavata TaxID=74557 RepID=A0A1V9ZCT3_9STRA|nr:hypothetical protein THRCLA_07565 [Thraustotheca clavata]
MYSLDIKRMQEKRKQEMALILKRNTVQSPQSKEKRVQKLYGKSTPEMYSAYHERVDSFIVEPLCEWSNSYGIQAKTVANPLIWPRDIAKEIQPHYIDAGMVISNYESSGRNYRGGGEQIHDSTPLSSPTTSPFRVPTNVFQYDKYSNPIESPFRLRLKDKEIQPPLKYNSVVRHPEDKVLESDQFDMSWTEAAVVPQWRDRVPGKWCNGDFGLTFTSANTKTASFQGISCISNGATLDSTEPYSPATARAPAIPSKFTARATTAPVKKKRLYLNSILTAEGGLAATKALSNNSTSPISR